MNDRSRGMHARDQRGQVFVIFILLLPVFLGLGSIVISLGNWYIHKKHLQTLVDAGAFATSQDFVGCFDDPGPTNTRIANAALRYAGDTGRDPTTFNIQTQEPSDVHVVLNSNTYWSGNPYPADNTLGTPCSTSFADVKATEDKVPLLFRWLPAYPSPKAKARVEMKRIRGLSGMLPLAIPEVDPAKVFAFFVNEATGTVFDWQELQRDPASPLPYSVWRTMAGQEDVAINSPRTGVVILLTRSNSYAPVSPVTLANDCSQGNNECYAGSGPTSGLAYVRGWATTPGSPISPTLRAVRLQDLGSCSDTSRPHFARSGGCVVGATVDIDFGVTGDPSQSVANGGIAASVRVNYSGCPGNGCSMQWVSTTGTVSTWTTSTSATLPAAGSNNAGRQTFTIAWRTGGGSFTPLPNPGAIPYVANDFSGPVEHLWLTSSGVPAYSAQTGQTQSFVVELGLQKPLSQTPKLAPPTLLRFKFGGSTTQSVNCDTDNIVYPGPFKPGFDLNSGGFNKDAAEIAWGCVTKYNVNRTGVCPPEYDDPSELPPATTTPDPVPTCVRVRPGQVNAMQTGLDYRFEQPCTNNNWPKTNADPVPKVGDPRYVVLMVTDFAAFDTGDKVVKVRRFAGFYVTGWDKSNSSGGVTDGCPGLPPGFQNDPHPLLCPNSPPDPCNYQQAQDDGDIWGHWVDFVTFAGADPSDETCDLTLSTLEVCVAVLVE